MSDCTHDCDSCGAACGEREGEKPDFRAPMNQFSHIERVIGVVSGKGGVGKSMVTASLACAMRARGMKVGILDADITGPSIPNAFALHETAEVNDAGILPRISKTGIEVMSLNLLTKNETDPVIWRGPVLAGVVKQFWTDVLWGELDFLFVDMPPGTGDVPLTVFQSLPVDGVVVVTSPQDLVSMIVHKAVNMAAMMEIPVVGLVENYSYFKCPDCGKEHAIFGPSKLEETAKDMGIPVLARIPIDPALAAACDRGEIEDYPVNYLTGVADLL
ncbi:MAG: Mrp/NBP35 family ATP-binding protein [Oscillospiraceae bacterium]|nr:Mrp/NBP35 family ATP-binding protein [Oscillospiraceae bacterium]